MCSGVVLNSTNRGAPLNQQLLDNFDILALIPPLFRTFVEIEAIETIVFQRNSVLFGTAEQIDSLD